MKEKIFVDIEWLWKFFEEEGQEAYHSLLKSNGKIVSNGQICVFNLELELTKELGGLFKE